MKTPKTLHEALRLAADIEEQRFELEQQLFELRASKEYPEVLRPAHIEKLLSVSKSTVSEWARNPSFPVLNKYRKKGESIMVLKSDLYLWLKTSGETNTAV